MEKLTHLQISHTTQRKKHRYNIILLAFWYTILIGSIVLAFSPDIKQIPKQSSEKTILWSAKENSAKGLPSTSLLPVNVTRWWEPAPKPIVEPKKNLEQLKKIEDIKKEELQNIEEPVSTIESTESSDSTENTKITCKEVGICEKVRFSEWYSNKQKEQYYSIILGTIHKLQENILLPWNIADTLFSISLVAQKWERRWRWWSRTIILHTPEMKWLQEFREVLTHELGHTIDLWMLVWSNTTLDPNFVLWTKTLFPIDDVSLWFYSISWTNSSTRKANAVYTDFVAGYAMTNPYEDFAETFNMYLWHQDVFREMMATSPVLQKKYAFMQKIMWNFFFSADADNVYNVTKNPQRRPWDTTRLRLD
jgi:hypothetical protein